MSTYGFIALALRQRLIKRWSLMHSSQSESVLEHSAVVAMLAMIAGEIALHRGTEVNLAVMMSHALVHDMTEILTGDVVTPVKKAGPELSNEFQKIEIAAQEKLLNTLPSWLSERLASYFAPGGYEQKLVKGCDIYAAYIKCKQEVSSGNGVEFQDAMKQIQELLIQIQIELPEIAELDKLFGESIGHSVDKLLSNGKS